MDINKKKAIVKKTTNMFFSGVFVLTLANILVKVVGLISKIVLNRVVGSIGAGYYSSAYEIYAYLYVISTSGLPVALSIMVSKSRAKGRFKEAKKIFDITFLVFLIIGVLFSSFMIMFADNIADLIGAKNTTLCIISIAPTMLFICLSSCFRGYFQGYRLMQPTAISQLIEAVLKVGVGITLAIWAKKKGFPDYKVAAYTIMGVTIGVLLGLIYLYIKKLLFKENQYNAEYAYLENDDYKSTKRILKELFLIAIPITLSSSVLTLTTILDTVMMQKRLLAYGMNEIAVRIYYGDYTSLVIAMFNMPTVLFYPIANALVPLISATYENGSVNKNEEIRALSIRIITIISLPCAVGLGVFAYPILDLLMFKQDSVQRAAPWLSIAAVSVLFLGIISVTNAFLNSAGKQRLPIVSMLVGACVKLISNYILLGKIGIVGAPISTVLCYLSAATLNVLFTVKYVGKLPSIRKIIFLPFLASFLSIGTSAVLFLILTKYISMKLTTVLAILLSVLLYFIISIRLKSITRDDIMLIPKGEQIVKLISKVIKL